MALEPSELAHREVFHMLCGDLIGQGVARRVYQSNLAEDEVVKIESSAGSFQNVLEWETWRDVRETPWARFFAPCVAISPCGVALIQKRTKRPATYPDWMPAFFTDFKRSNYGMLGHEFVCHDYGTNLLMQTGLTKRLRKVKWWEIE